MKNVLFSPAELVVKGITRRDVARMLSRAEKLCDWHAKRHTLNGTSPSQQTEWDNACARWDHLKTTLESMQ